MIPPAVLHATRSELGSELWWTLHIDPIAREHDIERPTQLRLAEPDRHLLEDPDGELLLIVRTDREDA